MTPKKPTKNPIALFIENVSSLINVMAKGKTKSGTVAIEIPAKPLDTYCCPQLNNENGIALDNNPIPKQCSQIRKPTFVRKVGKPLPEINANVVKHMAAIMILAADNVNGEKPSNA
jgi:hypothetical protein